MGPLRKTGQTPWIRVTAIFTCIVHEWLEQIENREMYHTYMDSMVLGLFFFLVGRGQN